MSSPSSHHQQQSHLSKSSSLSQPVSPPPSTPLRSSSSVRLQPTSPPERRQQLSRTLANFLSSKDSGFANWIACLDAVFSPPSLAGADADKLEHHDGDSDSDHNSDVDNDVGEEDSAIPNDLNAVEDEDLRISALKTMTKSRHFNILLVSLRKKRDKLPQSFVQRVFIIDPTTKKARFKEHQKYETLLDQLDQLGCNTLHSTRVMRLETLLEHAFVDQPVRRPDRSLVAVHSSATDFTSAFNGPSLSLLHDHLVVHNSFFSQTSAPASVHASTSAKTDVDALADPAGQDHREYYAKVLPILQSSGFGKTRMCVQLSTIHPGMLVCLRNSLPRDQDEHLVSFPPQDTEVYRYFQSAEKTLVALGIENRHVKFPTDADQHAIFNAAHLRILAWLDVYCDTIFTYLAQLKAASGCFDQHGNANHANSHQCWRTIVYHFADATSFKQHTLFQKPPNLCSHSRLARPSPSSSSPPSPSSSPSPCPSPIAARLKDDVAAGATATAAPDTAPPALQGTSNLRHKILEHICASATSRYDKMLKEYKAELGDPNMLMTAVKGHLKKRLHSLESLPPVKAASQSFFFLALDECGSFDVILPLIRRVWFLSSPKSSWILLIDTNSDIAPVAGTAAREGSRRTSDFDTHQLTQPFCGMPLDVNLTYEDRKRLFAPGLATPPVTSLPTLSDLNLALYKLGRPLWSDSRYHSHGLVRPRAILGKLVWPAEWQWPADGASVPLEPTDFLNQNLLALASRRITLELSSKPGPEHWYNVVSRQIAHHLRFVGRIFSTSDAIISSTPSEPSLSAAAAWSFRTHGPDSAAARWSMVVQAIVLGSQLAGVNVGAEGEQGVALLCSMAIDVALSCRLQPQLGQSWVQQPSSDDKLEYDAIFGLVSVREWLQTLVGNKYLDLSHGDHVGRKDDSSSHTTSIGIRTDNLADVVMAEGEQEDDEQQTEQLGTSAKSGMPSSLARWASRAWLNFKHIVTPPKQVAQDDEAKAQGLLFELWFRHAAAQGIINQAGWDFLIPVYESESEQPPPDDEVFQARRLSYIAIQVKNRVKRPSREELDAAVGPSLEIPAAASSSKQCLELFIDLRGNSPETGHVYSQRRHPSTSPLLRHHLLATGLDGAAWPVLAKLKENAKNQVGLLFGNADSVNTLRFDQAKARYVRGRSPQHQQAWDEVETAVNGALVRITEPNVCWQGEDADHSTNDLAAPRKGQKRKTLDP
ncbi:uncharacterized protein UTRI_10225 [Ustilago trichophora]|uniref:Uncharacterized protein n=1 Tax=Ustilago trichophora TaxID=86804 RepID=A0A5C3EHV4_9BASI|nr:uncharacterized protein UTRI_10225 [Ustilago trichophora]